jgi:hypothetical protein
MKTILIITLIVFCTGVSAMSDTTENEKPKFHPEMLRNVPRLKTKYNKAVNLLYVGLVFYQGYLVDPKIKNSIGITLNYSNERLNGMIGFDPFNKSVFVGAGVKILSW